MSRQHARMQEQRVDRRERSPTSHTYESKEYSSETLILVAALIALRVVAVYLVLRIARHLQSLCAASLISGTAIHLVILPLSVVLVDQSSNMGLAFHGNLSGSWMNLIQSAFSTYFFLRPLNALTGGLADPAGGRVGFGACLLSCAAWMSVPGLSRKSCAILEQIAVC